MSIERIALGIALALLVVSAVAVPAARADKAVDDAMFELQLVPLDGKPAPAFEVERFSDGKKVTLAELKGKPVLLYFWATWCPYCTKELPSTMERLHREYKDRGLVVLPISIEEARPAVAGWSAKQTLTIPLMLDTPGTASHAYQITATPTAFLVSRDGMLIGKAIGTKEWTSQHGRTLLQLLLRP